MAKAEEKMTLEEVTSILDELRLPLSLVYTPTNLKAEKEKFHNDKNYNPQFKYRIVNNNNSDVFKKLEKLREIEDVDPRISDFYLELIQSKKEANELMHAVGDNKKVTEISTAKYKAPSSVLFRNACRTIRTNGENYNVVKRLRRPGEPQLEYDQIKTILEAILSEYNLADWTVNKSKNISKNGVKTVFKRREILIDPFIKRSAGRLKKTIIHEICTHVFRTVNGINTGFEALAKPNVQDYLDIEEGLALYNEEKFGVLSERALIERALYVYCVYSGVNMSFRELYNAVSLVVPRITAFDVTFRVKRGLSDTSKPGIFAKDGVYFRGFRKVRRKIAEDTTLYDKLYSAKISLRQVEWVEDGLLKKASLIPDKSSIEKVFKKVGV